MNRRSFLRFFGAGAATLALSEAIPFGRVWSFPSKIVVPEYPQLFTIEDIRERYLAPAAGQLAKDIDAHIVRDYYCPTIDIAARYEVITLKRTAGFRIDYVPA